MVFPLLEFVDTLIGQSKVAYPSAEIAAARLALLRPTHMVDYAIDTYKSVHGDAAAIPAEMQEQKDKVYKELEELKKGCAPLDTLCKNEEERVSFGCCCASRVDEENVYLFSPFPFLFVSTEQAGGGWTVELGGSVRQGPDDYSGRGGKLPQVGALHVRLWGLQSSS